MEERNDIRQPQSVSTPPMNYLYMTTPRSRAPRRRPRRRDERADLRARPSTTKGSVSKKETISHRHGEHAPRVRRRRVVPLTSSDPVGGCARVPDRLRDSLVREPNAWRTPQPPLGRILGASLRTPPRSRSRRSRRLSPSALSPRAMSKSAPVISGGSPFFIPHGATLRAFVGASLQTRSRELAPIAHSGAPARERGSLGTTACPVRTGGPVPSHGDIQEETSPISLPATEGSVRRGSAAGKQSDLGNAGRKENGVGSCRDRPQARESCREIAWSVYGRGGGTTIRPVRCTPECRRRGPSRRPPATSVDRVLRSTTMRYAIASTDRTRHLRPADIVGVDGPDRQPRGLIPGGTLHATERMTARTAVA